MLPATGAGIADVVGASALLLSQATADALTDRRTHERADRGADRRARTGPDGGTDADAGADRSGKRADRLLALRGRHVGPARTVPADGFDGGEAV